MAMTTPKKKTGVQAVKAFFGMTLAEMKEEFSPMSDEDKAELKALCEAALDEEGI